MSAELVRRKMLEVEGGEGVMFQRTASSSVQKVAARGGGVQALLLFLSVPAGSGVPGGQRQDLSWTHCGRW